VSITRWLPTPGCGALTPPSKPGKIRSTSKSDCSERRKRDTGSFSDMLVDTCGSPVTTTGRPPTGNATPYSPPVSIRDICLKIRLVGRGMIAPASSRRSTTSGLAIAWPSGNWTTRPLAVASPVHCHYLTGTGRGVSLPDRAYGYHHPARGFLLSVFGALAQYQRVLTQERIRAGLEATRRRGKRGGRPQAISPDNWRPSSPPGCGNQQSLTLPDVRCETYHPL
jgi:resolvase-like protein